MNARISVSVCKSNNLSINAHYQVVDIKIAYSAEMNFVFVVHMKLITDFLSVSWGFPLTLSLSISLFSPSIGTMFLILHKLQNHFILFLSLIIWHKNNYSQSITSTKISFVPFRYQLMKKETRNRQ